MTQTSSPAPDITDQLQDWASAQPQPEPTGWTSALEAGRGGYGPLTSGLPPEPGRNYR